MANHGTLIFDVRIIRACEEENRQAHRDVFPRHERIRKVPSVINTGIQCIRFDSSREIVN